MAPERDQSGSTAVSVEHQSARERFHRASERYEELNEFVAEETQQIRDDKWKKSGALLEFFPLDGGGMEAYLRGANRDNSYYFEVTRFLPGTESLSELQQSARERWVESGWSVKEEWSDLDETLRVKAITDSGYWVALDEEEDGLYLTAHTPPYWGEYLPLADDIHERYEAEKARGEHARYDIEEDEHLSLLPGDYRPFPRWDAVE